MKRLADLVKGSSLQNPFSDNQARSFSDSKLINEFCPISNFWTLFNDQHEVLLGTRGSGKTFLLKMMRYSMLKHIQNPQAQALAQKKEYIALYVPMYLEFVTQFTCPSFSEKYQVQLFQFAFNCLLAQSLLVELKEIISEEPDKMEWAKNNLTMALELNNIWFNDDASNISDLPSLSNKLTKLFFNFDVTQGNMDSIPPVFKRQIGSSLLSVKEIISKQLNFPEEPTWVICIDEAEFLPELLQRCINSIFRSDSRRVALKVATLPFYHRTLQTLEPNISVSAGNDFSYRIVDMAYDSVDFRNLTNSLCVNRLKTRFDPKMELDCLEDFIGKYGEDAQIDYYRNEVGPEGSTVETITQNIISELSPKRKAKSSSYPNPRKTIYDKYAPIYYVRTMYRLSKKGNTKPGWYAGSQMIRKISQGNPRAFIQIMNNLFEKARRFELTPKAQHSVILNYAEKFCFSTKALESYGPTIYKELDSIAAFLHNSVHNSTIKSIGCNFKLTFDSETSFINARKWLQQAIAYSRIFVEVDTIENGISKETVYLLANTFAASYWLPMRSDVSLNQIKVEGNQVATYTVKMPSEIESSDPSLGEQLSLFKED